jgi:hypothetical protein
VTIPHDSEANRRCENIDDRCGVCGVVGVAAVVIVVGVGRGWRVAGACWIDAMRQASVKCWLPDQHQPGMARDMRRARWENCWGVCTGSRLPRIDGADTHFWFGYQKYVAYFVVTRYVVFIFPLGRHLTVSSRVLWMRPLINRCDVFLCKAELNIFASVFVNKRYSSCNINCVRPVRGRAMLYKCGHGKCYRTPF